MPLHPTKRSIKTKKNPKVGTKCTQPSRIYLVFDTPLALALGGSLPDGAWHLSKPEDRFMALAF
jgi:hypothetical protein